MSETFMRGKGGVAVTRPDGTTEVRIGGKSAVVEVKGSDRRTAARNAGPAGYQRVNLDAVTTTAWQAGMKAPQTPTDAEQAFQATRDAYERFSKGYEAWAARQRNAGKPDHDLKAQLAGAGLIARMLAYFGQMGTAGAECDVRIGPDKPCDLLTHHAKTAAQLMMGDLPCPLSKPEQAALISPPDANFILRALVVNCCANNVFDLFSRAVADTVDGYIPTPRDNLRSCIQHPRTAQAMMRELGGGELKYV